MNLGDKISDDVFVNRPSKSLMDAMVDEVAEKRISERNVSYKFHNFLFIK